MNLLKISSAYLDQQVVLHEVIGVGGDGRY